MTLDLAPGVWIDLDSQTLFIDPPALAPVSPAKLLSLDLTELFEMSLDTWSGADPVDSYYTTQEESES